LDIKVNDNNVGELLYIKVNVIQTKLSGKNGDEETMKARKRFGFRTISRSFGHSNSYDILSEISSSDSDGSQCEFLALTTCLF